MDVLESCEDMGVDAASERCLGDIRSAAEGASHSSHKICAEDAIIWDVPSSHLPRRDLNR